MKSAAPDAKPVAIRPKSPVVHVARTRSFADHHAFTAADVARLVQEAEQVEAVICTLKDAVKLGPLWPATAAPLWYVSQIAVFERGSALLDRALGAVLAARPDAPSTAGPAGHRSLKNGQDAERVPHVADLRARSKRPVSAPSAWT